MCTSQHKVPTWVPIPLNTEPHYEPKHSALLSEPTCGARMCDARLAVPGAHVSTNVATNRAEPLVACHAQPVFAQLQLGRFVHLGGCTPTHTYT